MNPSTAVEAFQIITTGLQVKRDITAGPVMLLLRLLLPSLIGIGRKVAAGIEGETIAPRGLTAGGGGDIAVRRMRAAVAAVRETLPPLVLQPERPA